MKRRDTLIRLLGLLGMSTLGAGAFGALAQSAARPARIAFLLLGRQPATLHPITIRFLDAFKQGMRELGHVEGKTFVIEARFSSAKAEELAKVLAAFKPDVKRALTEAGLLMPTVQMIFR